MRPCPHPERGATTARTLGIAAVVAFFVVMLVPIVALTFSVTVYGTSMQPTLREKDRLLTNFLARDDVRRFDLVDAAPGGRGVSVVKRVIAMPGDTVWITGGEQPRVHLLEAGSDTPMLVENPVWPDRIGTAVGPCCDADGKASQRARRATVPSDHYWVIGDNWGASDDSRSFGFVAAEHVRATVNYRIMPLDRFGRIANPGVRLVPAS